jgi:ABC-type transport system substrate-binding protein
MLVMAVTLVGLLAVACGADDEDEADAPAPAAPVAQPTSVPAPAPSDVVSDITLKMGVREVNPSTGNVETWLYGGGVGGDLSFTDHLLVHDGVDPLSPWAAKAWSVNDAGDELTLTIREDLKVNTPNVAGFVGKDFGFIKAADVAWNMNQQNAVVNPNLGAAIGAQLGATFAECNAVDEYTVKCPMITDIFWGIPISEFDINDTSVTLYSKTAYDEMGDATDFVPVGSGPWTVGEWKPEERGEIHAVPDHWADPPHIGTFVAVQVPDTTSRMAMMQTGELDLGGIDFGKFRELETAGLRFFQTMSDRDTMTLSAIWPGNLWTDLNAKTEEGITPWLSPVYEEDFPWIGCPWGDKCPYTDNDNPSGMSDMEQARLVRWGLSHAIDRQGIVDVLQAGLGTPIYQELMGPLFPGWRPERTVNAAMVKATHEKYSGQSTTQASDVLGPGTSWIEYTEYDNAAEPNHEWPWLIPTDMAEANRLLDLAGYPKGSDGIRFEIKMNKYACETGVVCLEQADAVAAGWEELGVRTTLLTEEYGAVVVPRMRDRTQPWPVVKNCSVETANYPFDWPPPSADSTFSRPAWGCSFENRFLDYMYMEINGERDKAKREDLHLDMVDYYYYWQLYSGMVQPPRGVAGNPKTVASWDSRSTAAGFWGRPQHIVPVK